MVSDTLESLELSGLALEALQELNRQGEACLDGTIRLALASDQRAVTLTGVFGAAATALAALLGAFVTAAHEPAAPLLIAIGVASLLFFLLLLACTLSAKPVEFFVGGYEPRLLVRGCSGDDTTPLLRASITDLQCRIDRNRVALERSARLLTCGLRLGLGALPAAVVCFITVLVAPHLF